MTTYPLIDRPPGFCSNEARLGFDVPDTTVIVPVARLRGDNPFTKTGITRTCYYDTPSVSYTELCARVAGKFADEDVCGSKLGVRHSVVRDARMGLLSMVDPTTGQVILGPGSSEPDLRWFNGSWMRICKEGPTRD